METVIPVKLTAKQQRMLAYIEDYIWAHRYAPSIREITAACGISTTSVTNYNLDVLQRLGLLTRQPEVSRSIVLASRAGQCPTCGCRCCG